MTITDHEWTLADAIEMIDDLRHQVRELREELETEVRTKRIVVVDDDDQELIFSKVDDCSAAFIVNWGSDKDGVSVYLQADNECAEEGYDGHVIVSAGGDITAWMRGGIEYEGDEYKRDGAVWLQDDEGKRDRVNARREQHMMIAPREIRTSHSPTAGGGGRVRFEYDPMTN